MKYHIEVREVYGRDQEYKPETTITGGQSFSHAKALEKAKTMQKYSNSVHYKVVRNGNPYTRQKEAYSKIK